MTDIHPTVFRDPPLPVAEQVYRVVREAIITLSMLPNERISENTLVQRLGVSRTPIREALQRLEREGLVVILPQRGSYVAPLDLQAIRSAYVTRLALESAVAGEAARHRSVEAVARLEKALEAQEALLRSPDKDGFFELNRRFHADLVEIADLSGLTPSLDSATAQLSRVRAAHLVYADPYPLEPLVEQHAAIVAAVAAADPEAAENAMRDHIQPLLPRLTMLMEERPDFFAQPRNPTPTLRSVDREPG